MREDRVVLVTGAASGIGAASAARFAAGGARVVLLDVDDERGREVAATVDGLYLHCDVASAADWAAAVATVRDRFGRIDVVFGNGPGRIVPTAPVHELSEV